jgi:hypothetical protein
MFGHHAIYVGERIVLFLVERPNNPDNGVCLATTAQSIPGLLADFPCLRPLDAYGPTATDWRLIPCDAEDFEESVARACELICQGDPRIGRIPKSRRKRR